MDMLQEETTNVVEENERLKNKLAESMLRNEELENSMAEKEQEFKQQLVDIEEANVDLSKALRKIEIKMKSSAKKSNWLWKRIDTLKLDNDGLKAKLEE
jgi:predicted  nucleic acid-binding Zn-ribbon protein